MKNESTTQFDFFSMEERLWHKQSTRTKKQLHDQLAQLLLSCLSRERQSDQTQKEDQPCQEK